METGKRLFVAVALLGKFFYIGAGKRGACSAVGNPVLAAAAHKKAVIAAALYGRTASSALFSGEIGTRSAVHSAETYAFKSSHNITSGVLMMILCTKNSEKARI